MQPNLNLTLFYVQNISATVELYADILNLKPIEHHPAYASFQLSSGHSIAFWHIDEVVPRVKGLSNSSELVFQLPSKQAVEDCFQQWQRKLKIIQKPLSLDFGYAFLAEDDNQIKLRVYADE